MKSKNKNLKKEYKYYFKELEKVDNIFIEILKLCNLGYPKPKNYDVEKKKFLKKFNLNEVYNPQIDYDLKKIDIKEFYRLKLKLSYLLCGEDYFGIKKLYFNKMKMMTLQVNYHNLWGTVESKKFIEEYWGRPGFFLTLKAKWLCKTSNFLKQNIKKTISDKQVLKELKDEVFRLTKDKVLGKVSNLNSKVSISPINKKIFVKDGEKFSEVDLKRLKIHEIGTHYMRYFNAKKHNLHLFEVGTFDYLETEEGLAAYNEFNNKVLDHKQLVIYAGRCIAARYCNSKNFYEIFKILKEYKFSDEDAFSITYRVKRNLFDTSIKNSGFPKDYVYFKGFYDVKKFISKNKKNHQRLMSGKISIQNVKDLKSYFEFIESKNK